jgi:hypothetical protein
MTNHVTEALDTAAVTNAPLQGMGTGDAEAYRRLCS